MSSQPISEWLNPFPKYFLIIGLALVQVIKFGIILSQPNSADFKYWFYQCFQYPPYSFHCVTVQGDTFPMAYSLLWYAVYVPLTAHGYWITNFTLLAADTISGAYIIRKSSQLFFALWTQGSLYFLLASPQDWLIWTIMLGGRHRKYGPVFLALAVMTKLPLIPPILSPAIWGYIAYNPYSLHDWHNWARYTLLGSYWLLILFTWLYKRGLLHVHVNSLHIHLHGGTLNYGNESRRTTDRPAGSSHRTSTSLDSSNINIVRINSTSTLLGSTKPRHHRAIGLRSNHTVRSRPAHSQPRRQKLRLRRNEGSTPKPQPENDPKALNPLRNIRRLSVLSGLFLLLVLVAIPPVQQAHAVTPLVWIQTNTDKVCNPCTVQSAVTVNTGDTIIVQENLPPACTLTSNHGESFTTEQASGQYIISYMTASTSGSYTWTCTGSTFGIMSVTDYRGTFNGFGGAVVDSPSVSGATGSDTATITASQGSLVYEGLLVYNNGNGSPNCPSAQQQSGQTNIASATTTVGVVCFLGNAYNSGPVSGPGQLNLSVSWSGCTSPGFCQTIRHSLLELTTVTASSQPTQSQCYGNCGIPAITLTNTNSTHTTNFNNSITLFYQFQSNINGFIQNITTTLAKGYSNNNGVFIGLYSTQISCTQTGNPFTAACPGFLVASSSPTRNPAKGVFSQKVNVQAQIGQWFGVAVTGFFQGLDLNDTNTNVPLYQTGGIMPGVINTFTTVGNSKLDLYAWATGNLIINGPSITGQGCNTPTCGVQALWISLGGDTFAAVIVFIILFGFIGGGALYITRQHDNQGHIHFALPGSVLLMLGILLLIGLSAIGVFPPWIPLAIIMIAAAGLGGIFYIRHDRGQNTA